MFRRMTDLFTVTAVTLILAAVPIGAQTNVKASILELSSADSAAIEQQVVMLVQTSLRGIFSSRTAPLELVLRYTDGRPRQHEALTRAALVNDRLPAALRASSSLDTLLVEVGAFSARGELILIDVNLRGPVRDGCIAYIASVGRHEGRWRRYVSIGNPMGCPAPTRSRSPTR